MGAALFQWVNPKAWLWAVSAYSIYLPAGIGAGALIVALAVLFAVINLPCVSCWTLFGSRLASLAQKPAVCEGVQYRDGGFAGGVAGADLD